MTSARKKNIKNVGNKLEECKKLNSEGRFEEALAIIKLDREPNNPNVILKTLQCYFFVGRFAEGVSYAKRMEKFFTQEDRNHFAYFNVLCKLYGKLAAHDSSYIGKMELVLKRCDQFEKLYDYLYFYHQNNLASYHRLLGDYESALKITDDALKVDTIDEFSKKSMLQYKLLLMRDMGLSIEQVSTDILIGLNPEEEVTRFVTRLHTVSNVEVPKDTWEVLPKQIELAKNSPTLLLKIALFCEKQHRAKLALEIYADINERFPRRWDTKLGYAFALQKQEDHEASIAPLKQLVNYPKHLPDSPTIDQRLKAYTSLAIGYKGSFDYTNALECIREGLSIREHAPLYSVLSKLLDNLNKTSALYHCALALDKKRFNKNHTPQQRQTLKHSTRMFVPGQSVKEEKPFVYDAKEFPKLSH